MTLDIAAIKARADAATDARFSLSGTYFDHVTNMWLSGVHIDGHAVSGPAITIKGNSVEFCNALRAFIAHARTDIPTLIAALEASEAARVKAQQELSDAKVKVAKYEMEAFKEAFHKAEAAKLRRLIPILSPGALESRK